MTSLDLAVSQFDTARTDVQALGARATERDRLREVATQFEALMIKQMLGAMRATLNEENRLVDEGTAGRFDNDMLYDEYAQMMAKTAGLGLADMIVNQLSPQNSYDSAHRAARFV